MGDSLVGFPPALQTCAATALVVVKVSADSQSAMAHVFSPETPTDNIIYAVAFRGHVRWAKPTEYCTPSEWGKWAENIDHIVYCANESAREYVELPRLDSEMNELTAFSICGDYS